MYIFTIGATQCHQLHYFNHHQHSKAKIKFFSRSLDCFCTKAYQWHWRNATGVDYLNTYPTLINALSTVHILKCLRRNAIVKSMHSAHYNTLKLRTGSTTGVVPMEKWNVLTVANELALELQASRTISHECLNC
jgi:hypothetical protein